jgi:hypothetical protein
VGSLQSSFQSLNPSINPAVSRDFVRRTPEVVAVRLQGRRTDASAEEKS